MSNDRLLIVTCETVAGRRVAATLGIVRGSTVRAKHVGSDIVAAFRNLVGGEIREYGQLLAAAREQALDRMADDARRLGADAVVSTRFETSQIAQNASEVLAYGTAVRLE